MAVEGRQDLWSFRAAADLSAKQYHIVKLDANGELVLAGAGDEGFVLADDPKSGEYGSVVVSGITKVVAGTAIAAGAYLSSDANGKAVPATETNVTGGTTGTHIIGQALSSASGANELVTVVVARGLA